MTVWSMLEVAFWICAAGCAYSYFIYPALLRLVPARPLHAGPAIIAARNEEKRIERKLRGTLELDYPRELLEILVASDASDDRTDEIVRSFASQG